MTDAPTTISEPLSRDDVVASLRALRGLPVRIQVLATEQRARLADGFVPNVTGRLGEVSPDGQVDGLPLLTDDSFAGARWVRPLGRVGADGPQREYGPRHHGPARLRRRGAPDVTDPTAALRGVAWQYAVERIDLAELERRAEDVLRRDLRDPAPVSELVAVIRGGKRYPCGLA
jgi:hypothetical protein